MTARASDPGSYPPEGLCRSEAARYVGVSATTFDDLVEKGEMPRPRRYKTCRRVIWLRRDLDHALQHLPVDGAESDDWGDIKL
jgi:excisionase family DNA binding protein